MAVVITGELRPWTDVCGKVSWSSLLIGNGASIAIWPRFRYNSLYATAALTAGDRELFTALDTSNFETVLDALRVSSLVCKQQRHDDLAVRLRYKAIRRALVEVVTAVHIPHARLSATTLDTVRAEMRSYASVYTTNYDLITYWALMSEGGAGFRDYFWGHGNSFDAGNVSVPGGITRVLYLHGAVHLYRDTDGTARKRTAGMGSLLSRVAAATRSVPLFVSEGRSADKLRAIRRSDYLSFAHREFAEDTDPVVVFGHSLSDQDSHLRDALNHRGRRVAISVMPGRRAVVREHKARLHKLLPHARLRFFDATTHTLGDRALTVQP